MTNNELTIEELKSVCGGVYCQSKEEGCPFVGWHPRNNNFSQGQTSFSQGQTSFSQGQTSVVNDSRWQVNTFGLNNSELPQAQRAD
ncbi:MULTISPECIES: CCRG-2 family RiPP [Prochlorococcus]|uniref:CCRG-2 family RiPP n=1 Tax=Prochlorococcus TaxID=1218 RepID=UPI0007B3D7DB|nr:MULTISPECIES: CCRG-2 family RiPP [Prochlorococcus]KZR66895.1 hypothetical protein PMIT1312_00678 [Prochlorococcus marinus str. MIT 1312]KZR81578.1 hypothetical protein PMIT1327_01088 [Prochlorococcus marinus str. MIT 1327]NMO84325.1 CCRG-2 family RiPP [Prochlorococcus sp. P1344]NMP05714.1 CCRG-2 family RiPP [Prochlorococcus sp. P1361]NMP13402.1 CCRG-2 family RiPP [Prochlorococcus sp.P1363]